MRIPFPWNWCKHLAIALLLLTGGRAAAQTADQTIKTIPQQITQSAATKTSTKSNTVANNAMNQLDSASNKAFKGFTGMFKKKKKSPADSTKLHATDSTRLRPADTTAVPVKSPA